MPFFVTASCTEAQPPNMSMATWKTFLISLGGSHVVLNCPKSIHLINSVQLFIVTKGWVGVYMYVYGCV